MENVKDKVLAEWELINRVSKKRFGETVLAEEAALAVMDGLQAEDWRRVRAYSGKASFSSFIATLAIRLVEDFARSRFGRVRPPAWLNHLGNMWKKLFTFLCLERLLPGEAVERIHQGGVTFSREEIEDAAYEILQRIPHCGSAQGFETEYQEGDAAKEKVEQTAQSATVAEEQQTDMLFTVLFCSILGVEKPKRFEAFVCKFDDLQIQLKEEERLLLKLRFQDSLGVSAAGKMLGWNRFQTHGRLRRLLDKLRIEFDRVGLTDELRLHLKDG